MGGNNGQKKTLSLFLLAALLLAGIGGLGFSLWKNGAFLPGWVTWEDRRIFDLSGTYRIVLQHKRVRVFLENEEIWTSPETVKVQEALSCDMDQDGQDELILLCWKVGRFGVHKPFWIKEDEKEWSQHIFVYEYGPDKVRPKWMSSYIGQDVARMEPNQTVAAQRRLWLTDPDGAVSSWIWNGWGFEKEDTEITFAVFGDLIAHEPIYRYGLLQGGFGFLFENVTDILRQKDVAVINQETPLTDDPQQYGGYPRFGTPVQVGEAVWEAGFDVVTCATNHMLDRGEAGAVFTKRFLEEKGISCPGIRSKTEAGGRSYEILKRKGVSFALFNYTYGTNGITLPEDAAVSLPLLQDEEKIKKELQSARKEADLVIVFVHWGTENAAKTDAFQQKWAQVFLAAKADVVVGTHPHAIQPVEVLEDEDGHRMLLYNSIGNFVSAQPQKSCEKGGVAEFTVSLTQEGYQVTAYDLIPLRIEWQEGGKYAVTVDLHAAGNYNCNMVKR